MRAKEKVIFDHFKKVWLLKAEDEIKGNSKEYILSIDEAEYAEYLNQKYTLEPILIDRESEHIFEPTHMKKSVRDYERGEYDKSFYEFTVQYYYTGSPVLFNVQSNPFTLGSYNFEFDSNSNTVSFKFLLPNQDPEKFIKEKDDCYGRAFGNFTTLNKNIQEINNILLPTIERIIRVTKNKFKQENDFFAAINVRKDKDTSTVFTPPTIKKKIIPQPKPPNGQVYSSEPTMALAMYKDVLEIIFEVGKSMERKPSTYEGKGEEDLRDQILLFLETRYVGYTATGETFNKSGKTDILLKYAEDGSNLFVAECKIWHGPSEYKKAISQLFDKYLTWRDSKAAIILFVKNKDFSSVLDSIEKSTLEHDYAIKQVGKRGDSSFSFHFRLNSDDKKLVLLEVIAFHFEKL